MFKFLKTKNDSNNSNAIPFLDDDRVYAIGDIHGRADLLENLLKKIKAHAEKGSRAKNTLVFLGDYVDRGTDSKKAIELVINFQEPGFEKITLKGNHEAMLLDYVEDASAGPLWFENGGNATLFSYGIQLDGGLSLAEKLQKGHQAFLERLPGEHLNFFKSLSLYYPKGKYVFVHAGIRPGRKLEDQVENDLLWIRDDFLNRSKKIDYIVVHGHSVTWEPMVKEDEIAVDTGAYATGILTCAIITNQSVEFLST